MQRALTRLRTAEADLDFRVDLLRLARKGMRVGAVLGIFAVLLFIGIHALFGREVTWTYRFQQNSLVLWDKLVIIGLFSMLLVMAGRVQLDGARFLTAVVVVVVVLASGLDDIYSGVGIFVPGYTAFFYLSAIIAIPFQPRQVALLGATIITLIFLLIEFSPSAGSIPHDSGDYIYMLILTILATGLSWLLYINRYDQFRAQREIEHAYAELKRTQAQLIQQEKLASLGSLTAGIAHEIRNPLNFINNFARLIRELAEEFRQVCQERPDARLIEFDNEFSALQFDGEKIEEHGRRIDAIIRAMIEHSHHTSGERRGTDINSLVEQYVMLGYHGRRAQYKDIDVAILRDYDSTVGNVEVVPQEIGRVLLNLLSNAFDSVEEQKKRSKEGYRPTISIRTRRLKSTIEIRIVDNGPGVPEEIRHRIFEPFFTTKPVGKGTGLGLSLSYDIITQGHGGQLVHETLDGVGAAFSFTLPLKIDDRSLEHEERTLQTANG